MAGDRRLPIAGYQLLRVYATEQTYSVLDPGSAALPAGDRTVAFDWDWQITGPRSFDVWLSIQVGASKQYAEIAEATVVGAFRATEGKQSIAFANFVRANAPAILLPYAREILSALTGKGPLGTYYLAPVNVVELVHDFDDQDTEGARQLATGGALAEQFGLEYYSELYPRPVIQSGEI